MYFTAIITSDDKTQAERRAKASQCLADAIMNAETRGLLEGLVHVRTDIVETSPRTTRIVSQWEPGGESGD